MIDAKAFGEELAAIVKAATSPLISRIGALEKALSENPAPKDGADGKDADPDVVASLVHDRIKGQLDAMQKAIDGIEVVSELPDIPAMIKAAVTEAVNAIPAPQDGMPGVDGKSVTVEDVMPGLQDQVQKFLETIPMPQNGRDGTDGAPGQKGDPGRDGLDVKDLFRAEGGRLVAVMSDGTTKDLGQFVGKDGADGAPGVDGKDGSDGVDGLGFDDLTFEQDVSGRPVAKFQRGDVVKSVTLPCIIDRGPYRSGETYQKGDAVSYGGSLWIAQDATEDRPDGGKGWRLAVKKGRDGRDTEAKKVL